MRALIAGLTFVGFVAVAAAQQPPTPPPVPGNADSMAAWGEKMGEWGQKYGERMGRWGESLGKAFQDSGNRFGYGYGYGDVMADPDVKAAFQRYMDYKVRHDPRTDDARNAFHDAVHRWAERQRERGHHGMVPPIPPIPPVPGVPPMPPAMPGSRMTDAMRRDIDRARHDPASLLIPETKIFTVGARTVASTDTMMGYVATVDGPVDISGRVNGDVDVVDGDIFVRSTAHITGNAFAAHGTVHVMPGGVVDGEIRSLPEAIGPTSPIAAAPKAGRSPWRSLELSIAWLCLALVLGIGVLTFAGDRIDTASLALSDQFGRSMLFGLISLVAVIPVLAIIVVLLCITIIGIVVAPFAAIAYVLLVLGVAVLGFTAVAETTGHAFYRKRANALTDRGARLRAVVTGISIYMGLWVLAAAAGWIPVAGALLHAVAIAVTFVALTSGFGSVVAARYDARRAARGEVRTPDASSLPGMAWQTPTPVGGVAAARRPTPPPSQTPSS
ncbi:MAG TPA: polymer-forming cytoskeletal protein [Gemmatimonadaceae bacterium]|nr:polymer-forming cytoskeletal protein [Gemmatimonadaceae bacterium]